MRDHMIILLILRTIKFFCNDTILLSTKTAECIMSYDP